MRRGLTWSATAAAAGISALAAACFGGAGLPPATDRRAVIDVSINPEGRVSAHATGTAPPVGRCGEDQPLTLRIVNEGYVTAPLVVRADPTTRRDVSLTPPAPLSGDRIEFLTARYRIHGRSPVEVTLAFSAGIATRDLGGRSLVPLILSCS